MEHLPLTQYALIGALFVWSGFVRSGLGFGGAVLVLPFLLFIVDDPLVFLPLIAVQQILFGGWAALRGWLAARSAAPGEDAGGVDWPYLGHALRWIAPPALLGVLGLLTLPSRVMSIIIFTIVLAYALGYVFDRPIRSRGPKSDAALLALGGYINGTSLIGGPLIVSVFANHVARHRLRDTLLAAWVVVVGMKLASFVLAGVELQLQHQLWLLPCVLVGHLAGDRLHDRLLRANTRTFFRGLGVVLLAVSVLGLTWSLR